ncbi:hypothetical protein INS49_010907 [Diaporthe citri]|uniref:uncharacterized protein n=1 Tax=Diaporthe citri TaxID=83186 RepID=UPI001C7E5F4D|nr:uncharacterized protein INS49_010907 [Diaporthe citri]KAG6359854.1 hypothetical protein INS49_010907 [Diaporthe citri]
MFQIRELAALTGSLLYLVSSHHAAAALPETKKTGEYGLNDAAKAHGKLYFGTSTEPSKFLQDAAYYKQLNNTHDFGQLVAEGSMKWDELEPERNVFDFSVGDHITGLAAANGQITRCHNLLWHLSTPDWVVNGGFDNATLISIIENHITEVVKHYKGSCYAWDVVNEAVVENGTWRSSVFYDTIGPAYIPIAFAAAAKVDPDVKLYYNDFAIELPSPKFSATVDIVNMVRAYGAKIDGVGLQAHYDLSGMPPEAHFELGSMPSYDEQVAVMRTLDELDLDFAINEMDVSVLTPGNATIFHKQAETYYNATAACLNFERCVGITGWEWTDKYSWVPHYFPNLGDALPWDKDLNKKPAYYGTLRALKEFNGTLDV